MAPIADRLARLDSSGELTSATGVDTVRTPHMARDDRR